MPIVPAIAPAGCSARENVGMFRVWEVGEINHNL